MNAKKTQQKSVDLCLNRYLNDISNIPLLSKEEEVALGYRIQAGDKYALQKLVLSNLRFVIKIAKKFRMSRVHLLDLINEGNVGLIIAATRFDPTLNVRFISYAVWWIRQKIFSYLSKTSLPFKVPSETWNTSYRITKVVAKIKDNETGRPDRQFLAEAVGVSMKELNRAMDAMAVIICLDHPDDASQALEDTLEQNTFKSAEDETITANLKKHLKQSLSILTPFEQKVLTLRFGLEDGNPLRLYEIGTRMNRSRERIRQIEGAALTKLRKSPAVSSLLTYLN